MEICEERQNDQPKIDQKFTETICETPFSAVDEGTEAVQTVENADHQITKQTRKKQHIRNRKEKEEIVNKFRQMKREFAAAKDKRPYEEINREITEELGVSIRTISLWQRELGVEAIVREYSNYKKIEMIKRYDQMKALNTQLRSDEICKRLKISKTSLFEWKKQLADGQMKKTKTLDEKRKVEIVQKYEQIKNENGKMKDSEIAKKLKICPGKLLELRKKLQPNYKKARAFSMEEKQKFIHQFDKIIGKKEQQSVVRKDKLEIAERVGINLRTIDKWKSEMGLKILMGLICVIICQQIKRHGNGTNVQGNEVEKEK
ncbi:hypothetical protein niasHT_006582 [Heterodera trifolii]|uniref:Transposase n=1 Tax=Heterodera trifolii TaxID=157864 RepID=A0ABD2M7J1_9BILA